VNPGALVIVRDDHVHNSPNHQLRAYRAEAATAIRNANLDTETRSTIWALVLAAEGWPTLAGWVRSALAH
jgi:hypothetical protein